MDKKIKKNEQADILFTLGKLLNNGFSIASSIKCLKIKYNKYIKIFKKIECELQNGEKLTNSFKLLGLSEIIVSQLCIAEENGLLKSIVRQTGELLNIQNKQLKKIKLLMLYPIFIFCFLLVILVFIKLFFKFDYEPSFFSNCLNILDLVMAGVICGLVIISIYKLIKIKKSSSFEAINQKIKLPIVGKIYKLYCEYNLLFGIGSIIKNGLKVSDICKLSFSNNSLYENLRIKLNKELRKGVSLSDFIKDNRFIPNELDILLSYGANHVDLGNEILVLAQLKYDETMDELKKVTVKLQPLVFGIIAVLILITYLKILIPVYGMMEGMY
ncbi:type II secretion system F family protein [Companilactobacillus sp. DQM5]|uniref:type II secretion system F family protein n=1 Tax=Companilactobacillus sp. DQM5 TaxID=3463359 RepID=UPI0040597248